MAGTRNRIDPREPGQFMTVSNGMHPCGQELVVQAFALDLAGLAEVSNAVLVTFGDCRAPRVFLSPPRSTGPEPGGRATGRCQGWFFGDYALSGICGIEHIDAMATSFELLADPTRRRLLDELRRGERSVGELVVRLGLKQPAVSKQLRVLREAGLATARVDAQRRIYRLNPDGLREVDRWLAPYRKFWEARLDDLERTLDEMEE